MPFEFERIVCAILPIGESLEFLANHQETNAIIGFDQYCRLKKVLPNHRIELFDNSKSYGELDVLLIMSTIWTVPFEVLHKFRRIVYFFDDIEIFKAELEKYKNHMKFVSLVLHPEPDIAKQLQEYWDIPTVYMPWSSARLPTIFNRDESRIRVFLDVDARNIAAHSIERATAFVNELYDCEVEIYVPSIATALLPSTIIDRVVEVPRLSHGKFLEFMGNMNWYASGIHGSYEYVAMESALLGCGLISLNGAVRKFHRERACVVDFPSSGNVCKEIFIANRNNIAEEIQITSRKLYPFDAVADIPRIFRELL